MLSLILPVLVMQLASPAPPADNERCWKAEVVAGIRVQAYQGDRKCVDFSAPRQISGIWINEFESSAFYEGARTIADTRGEKPQVWFSTDEETKLLPHLRPQLGHAYRITIIGRAAADMDRGPMKGYGHMSMSPGLVLADRIIAIEDLGSARGN
jgi:hypothetical protein